MKPSLFNYSNPIYGKFSRPFGFDASKVTGIVLFFSVSHQAI